MRAARAVDRRLKLRACPGSCSALHRPFVLLEQQGAVTPSAFTTASTERVDTRCTHAASITATSAFSARRGPWEIATLPQLRDGQLHRAGAPPRSAHGSRRRWSTVEADRSPYRFRRPSTSISITRLATQPIIFLRRSSSGPFSTSAFRVTVPIVTVRALIAIGSSQTRANCGSDHDSPSAGVPGTPCGQGLKGGLPGRPTASVQRPHHTRDPTRERRHEHY
jgi:hypothetical protein